jgi:tRNA-dihydrouridine synthase
MSITRDRVEKNLKALLKKSGCLAMVELPQSAMVQFFDENVEDLVELELPKIIGNGDILNINEIDEKVKKYKIHGGMIGRGIFTDPFAFNREKVGTASEKERLDLLLFHLNLWKETWNTGEESTYKPYPSIKKFFKIYVNGFSGAVALRAKLMETENADEAIQITQVHLEVLQDLQEG